MPYPSIDEFKRLLARDPLDDIIHRHLFTGVPYVFQHQPHLEGVLTEHLCQYLPIQPQGITIIGSAKIGFSLSPDAFPRQFSEASDIDVLVVDEALFDQVWLTLLRWHYPRRHRLPHAEWQWAKKRQEELYWGWFTPDRIAYQGLAFPHVMRPLRDLSTAWFNAFRSLSRYPELARRDVSGRLYRTWEHALNYQAEGLRRIRESIAGDREGA